MKVVRKIQAGKAVADLELDRGTYYLQVQSGDKGKGKKNTDYEILTDLAAAPASLAYEPLPGHPGIGSDGGAGSGFRRIRPRSRGPGRLDARHAGACLTPFPDSFRFRPKRVRHETGTKYASRISHRSSGRPPEKSIQDKAEAVCSSPCRYRNSARAMDSP